MGIIPTTVKKYDDWKTSTNDFLQSEDPANPGHKQYERLGLTLAEATAWADETAAWILLYAKYKDKDQRTLTVMRALRDMRVKQTKQTRPVINRIKSSGLATQQDASVFHFVLNPKQPQRRKTWITEQVFAAVKRTGSTEFEVQCRFEDDAKKAALLPGSDGVEVSFKISDTQPADPATVNPEGEGFRQRTYGKARFLLKAGTANKGKYLIIAFRWNYLPNTDFNGPWTEVQVMAIF